MKFSDALKTVKQFPEPETVRVFRENEGLRMPSFLVFWDGMIKVETLDGFYVGDILDFDDWQLEAVTVP